MAIRTGLFTSAAIGALAFALPAHAQSDADRAESPQGQYANEGEIVVTARRREERLADVPTAASVIDAQSLVDRGGAFSSGELLADQPSVRFNNLNSAVTSEISMRASSTARATNGDPSVGLYRNGSYIGGGAIGGRNFTRLDMMDIGRVEVLRGTQGALYGRNAVGGAINIVSARPEFGFSGYARARYSFENDSTQLQAAANIPVSDTVALRFSADAVNQTGGFFYNPYHDVYFDRSNGFAARGQARIRSGALDVTFLAEIQAMIIPSIHYQVSIAPGTPGYPGGYTQEKFSYPWNTRPRAEQNVEGLQIFGSLDLGGGTSLNWASLYRARHSRYDLDNDAISAEELARAKAAGLVSPLVNTDTGSASYVIDTTRTFNQNLYLNGTAANGRLHWLAGADVVILDSNYQVTTTRTPTPANASTGTRAPAKLDYRSYAAYGSLGFDITDALSATGEIRYTKDDRSLWARLLDRVTGANVGGAARMVDAGTRPDNISYNATLSYKTGFGVLGYAKVGSSYRAGGFNTNLGDPRQPVVIPAAYGNEKAMSYEAGIKGNPASNLYFAIAGYYNKLDNLIGQLDNGCAITLPACPVAAVTFLTNAGNAKSYGVEGELTASFDLGGGKLRAQLSGSWQGGRVTSGRYDGLDLPQVPDYLASASLNYRHPAGKGAIVANAFYTAQWGGFQELRVNSVPLDDFQQLNLKLGYETERFSIAAIANNVTNEVHYLARDTTIRRYSQPRLLGIEAGLRW